MLWSWSSASQLGTQLSWPCKWRRLSDWKTTNQRLWFASGRIFFAVIGCAGALCCVNTFFNFLNEPDMSMIGHARYHHTTYKEPYVRIWICLGSLRYWSSAFRIIFCHLFMLWSNITLKMRLEKKMCIIYRK